MMAMNANPYIKQKRSRIHNHGLYAARKIPENVTIIEYTGVYVSDAEVEAIQQDDASQLIYLFELDDGRTIDGDTDDNIAKYINHSCEPNCYSEIEDGHIYIKALRDITRGEELTYDYGFPRKGWMDHPCLCGSQHCFGFIVAQMHRKAIAKTKKYQQWQTTRGKQ